MGLVMVLFIFFSNPIIRIFTQDEAVIKYGVEALQIFGSAYIFYGIGMVMTQALNGAGDTKTPTWINFICFWVIQIPLAWYLSKHMDMKATGGFISIPIAETLLALTAWYYFKKGRWKEVKI
jgi:Na+-driven multidrug efflux pump